MTLPVATAAIFLGCLLTSTSVDVSAPGEEGLHKLYGNPTMERFAVRSGITLTAEYGPDRIACELLIAPAQTLIELHTPIPPMSSKGVSDVLQEVLPVATSGKQINSDTVEVQSVTLLKTDYENVSIRRFCSLPSCVSSNEKQDLRTLIVFKRSTCPTHVE
jgi:hypothetical protein